MDIIGIEWKHDIIPRETGQTSDKVFLYKKVWQTSLMRKSR